MKREGLSTTFPIGSTLPSFKLQGTDGSYFDSDECLIEKGLLVVFSCNHCPYVKGSESMLIDIARKYASEGLKTVTINSNDPVTYPEDSFEKMKEKVQNLNLPYPYLFDETQETAKTFDAACTPECYLFDAGKRLVYHGAINDNHKDPLNVDVSYLATAVEQLLLGTEPDPAFVHPFGCSIKWKR